MISERFPAPNSVYLIVNDPRHGIRNEDITIETTIAANLACGEGYTLRTKVLGVSVPLPLDGAAMLRAPSQAALRNVMAHAVAIAREAILVELVALTPHAPGVGDSLMEEWFRSSGS